MPCFVLWPDVHANENSFVGCLYARQKRNFIAHKKIPIFKKWKLPIPAGL
jgi:hypothetical protein